MLSILFFHVVMKKLILMLMLPLFLLLLLSPLLLLSLPWPRLFSMLQWFPLPLLFSLPLLSPLVHFLLLVVGEEVTELLDLLPVDMDMELLLEVVTVVLQWLSRVMKTLIFQLFVLSLDPVHLESTLNAHFSEEQ